MTVQTMLHVHITHTEGFVSLVHYVYCMFCNMVLSSIILFHPLCVHVIHYFVSLFSHTFHLPISLSSTFPCYYRAMMNAVVNVVKDIPPPSRNMHLTGVVRE